MKRQGDRSPRGRMALLLLALLSGCAGAPPAAGIAANPVAGQNPAQPSADIPGAGTVTASFVTGGEDEVIVIRSLDRQAIKSASLVEPDGRVTAAFSIDRSADPSATGLAGAPYAADMPSMSPVPGLFSPPPLGSITQTETLSGQTLSAASIRLPDRDLYGKNWRNDRLRVVIGMADGDQRTIIMAAPRPPGP